MAYENIVETVLPFATRTATPASSSYASGNADRMNRDQSAMIAVLSVTTAPGGGASLIVKVNGIDRVTETFNAVDTTVTPPTGRATPLTNPYLWSILESDPVTIPGLYVYRIHPTLVPVSGLVVQDFVPRFFQLVTIHGDQTSSWVYALSYQMVEA